MNPNYSEKKLGSGRDADTAISSERIGQLLQQLREGVTGKDVAWELGIHFDSLGEVVKELNIRLDALEDENRALQQRLAYGQEEYVQLRESMNELLNLHDLAEAISTSFNSEDILGALMDLSGRVIPYDSCGVFPLPFETNGPRVMALRSDESSEFLVRVTEQWEDGIIDWVLRERRTVVIDDIESQAADISRSFVFIPLMVGGKQIGIYVLHGNKAKADFTLGEIQLLDVLSNQTAVAIENSRLYTDLESAHASLKESQRQLLLSAKQAAIGELAGGVAHEVNNPLQIILSRVQLMISKQGNDPKAVDGLRLIENNVRRISKIIRALLGFASDNTEESAWTMFHVSAPLNQACTLVRHQLESNLIDIKLEITDDLPMLHGNVGELEQVFINLVLNAQNAMPDGGHIVITTRLVAAEKDHDNLEIRFTDTGIGIDHSHLDRIFQPFFTTHPDDGGTGLGLAVSYRIIETHLGSITVESEPGNGTTFIIRLPISVSSSKEFGDAALSSGISPNAQSAA
tara:strand:+ start:747 stop:2297 length:1551 start_codon:yes stop_codon:yes gene_type:complete